MSFSTTTLPKVSNSVNKEHTDFIIRNFGRNFLEEEPKLTFIPNVWSVIMTDNASGHVLIAHYGPFGVELDKVKYAYVDMQSGDVRAPLIKTADAVGPQGYVRCKNVDFDLEFRIARCEL